jgi:DNA-binding NarL/FixJ family response regulator
MTRLLFLPDDQSLLVYESPLNPLELADAVNRGAWLPPYASQTAGTESQPALQAFHLGRLVVVIPTQPLSLAPETLKERQPAHLTPRQRQVLNLLARGLTNKEIAARLKMHPRTVSNHIRALKQTFGASSRAQSVRRAAELGLLEK